MMASRSRVPSERDEVTRAAHELVLPASEFRILSEQEAAPVLSNIEAHFVKEAGHRWWWEAFRDSPTAQTHFADGTGWGYLSRIVPPESGLVWFVVEGDPEFVLCEATVEAVQSVIGECWAFEYYLVSQSLDWLIGENHSDVVFTIGEAVSERLAQVAS